MDKELVRKIDEGIEITNRIANALEILVNEPLVEIKTPPPQCPHCGEINPVVRILQHPEAQGRIAEFLISGQCTHCKKDVFCISLEWNLQPDEKSALMIGREVVERMKNVHSV